MSKAALVPSITPDIVINAINMIDFSKLTEAQVKSYLVKIDKAIKKIPMKLITLRKKPYPINEQRRVFFNYNVPQPVIQKLSTLEYKTDLLTKALEIAQTRNMVRDWIVQSLPVLPNARF